MERSAKSSFISRRSAVLGTFGSVASSQPLASQIGVDILKLGGNAADAAVAVAAALNLTEPYSTGIGGDAFCLFFDAETRTVKAINGSGRAPSALNLDVYSKRGYTDDNHPPRSHGLNVTVPGAAAAWLDTIERFGSKKLTVQQILQPAIDLAIDGYPVHQVTAKEWGENESVLKVDGNPHGADLLLNGGAPKMGQIMKMPKLAKAFQKLATEGKKAFYEGPVAEAIVDVIQAHGGIMTLEDLRSHTSTYEDPISVNYRGVRVWECPPNGQGITALMAFNILEEFDLKSLDPCSPEYIHLVLEALKVSFSDSLQYCADPSVVPVPVKEMLSKSYAKERRKLIDQGKALQSVTHGELSTHGDTVYFCVVDRHGNACSFINSIYQAFGSGLVPEGCGFALQNRGSLFRIQKGHPNCPEGGKRPYHTIIPSMLARDEDGALLAAYGVMGGFMQPQGHVQVVLNMVEFSMDPQRALDHPRFQVGISEGKLTRSILLEDEYSEETFRALRALGHEVKGPISGFERRVFGRGQIITPGDWWAGMIGVSDPKVLWAGSDPRADGMAISVGHP